MRWLSPMTFLAESGSGHAIVVDSAGEVGGRDSGPRPMELVLMAMGTCSAIDVMNILRKARQDVTDCVVELDGERAAEVPKVFTRVHARYLVTGRALSDKHVARAVALSLDKYCSVTRMLAPGVEISHEYELQDTG